MLNYRLDNRLTQGDMAKKLGISVPAYSLYENHKRDIPYNILIKFLELRDEPYDKFVVKVLNEFKKN